MGPHGTVRLTMRVRPARPISRSLTAHRGLLKAPAFTLGVRLIGLARVSTKTQDLTAQRDALAVACVDPDAIYVDHGFTGTQPERPGLGEALASCRNGHTR